MKPSERDVTLVSSNLLASRSSPVEYLGQIIRPLSGHLVLERGLFGLLVFCFHYFETLLASTSCQGARTCEMWFSRENHVISQPARQPVVHIPRIPFKSIQRGCTFCHVTTLLNFNENSLTHSFRLLFDSQQPQVLVSAEVLPTPVFPSRSCG